MKTEVIMKRELMGTTVRQLSHSELFNANDLFRVGSELRKKDKLSERKIGNYWDNDSSSELIVALCAEDGLTEDEIKKTFRGHKSGTWVHPIIFIDMAMWLSPKLKVRILKWVVDGLMACRDESGDSFKGMNQTLTECFPTYFDSPIHYAIVANRIATACGVDSRDKDRWQYATEYQLKLRDKIHNNIEVLADVSKNAAECITLAIRKALK